MRTIRWIATLLVLMVPFGAAQLPFASPKPQAAPPPQHEHVETAKEPVSAEEIWEDLMAGNKRFVSGKTKTREVVQLRHGLAAGQHPKVVVLACSDSRLSPELLFDKNLGDLFVIRTAGNIADPLGLGSIEYAVEHLGSKVLVVLGHEKCGAVTAACSGEKMPSPNLQAIVDKIGPAVTQAKSYAQQNELISQTILENVHQSAKDVLGQSAILRSALKDGKLTIFEAVYKLDSGEIVRLGKLAVVAPAFKLDVGDVVRVQ
jgi:carbonic anhydrase